MERLQKLEEKIKEGQVLTAEEALWLLEEAPFDALCETAHRITEAYASRKFDMRPTASRRHTLRGSLTCVLSSMPSRDVARKTANGAPSRHIITRAWRNTDW